MSVIRRSTVIDMLVAAQGEAFREWYESDDEYARAAVDRALAVVPSADSSGAVEALRKLAEIHHSTITPSRLHDRQNRDWTDCECKSCRLAQPFGGQRGAVTNACPLLLSVHSVLSGAPEIGHERLARVEL